MTFNKKTQYAFLLSLYLARSGRSTVKTAAANLGLSVQFLQNVAHKLKEAGIVASFRGPNGGYELTRHITMGEVFRATEPALLLESQEFRAYKLGATEHRAFANFVNSLHFGMKVNFSKSLVAINSILVEQELELMNTAEPSECGAV